MGDELLELCSDLNLDPQCIGTAEECIDTRIRHRSLLALLELFEKERGTSEWFSFDDYESFFNSTKTILTAKTKEEVQEHLQQCSNCTSEHGKEVLRIRQAQG
jgi:hypothetical protein